MAEYTSKGTLKRDPNAPKTEAPATPEERAARLAEARAKAAAAKAAREAGGGASAAPSAPAVQPAAAAEAAPAVEAAAAVTSAGGGERTAKGTLKRDPNLPKAEPPATPEERAQRVAEAKAKAAAAKAAREAGGVAAATALQPGAAAAAAGAAAARPAGESDAERAERRRIFDIVTRPVAGAEPVLRRIPPARAERAPARAEFPLSGAMQETVSLVRAALPGIAIEVLTSPLDPILVVDRADLLHVMRTLRDDPRLDVKFLRSISGVDELEQGIEVVYHLKSMTAKHHLVVKTLAPARDPVVDSVTEVWPAAEWHERELMEMFGVVCRNHPDPRNLLLDEDMTIHPLLKAHPLAEIELKQGVNVF